MNRIEIMSEVNIISDLCLDISRQGVMCTKIDVAIAENLLAEIKGTRSVNNVQASKDKETLKKEEETLREMFSELKNLITK